jgi:ABC-type transporter Mla subunit MlaD
MKMSQSRNKRQNNLNAGIFVSLSLILGLIVFSILTDAWSRITTSVSNYNVTFRVSEGIGTLASGSQVRLGGVLIGSVDSVIPRVENDSPTTKIDVIFNIDSQYTVYKNASIHSRSGLLGSSGWLEITDIGDGEVANSETELHGSTETMVSQLLGSDAEVNVSKSLAALRKISEALSDEGGGMRVLLGEEESKILQDAIDAAKSGLQSLDSILKSTDSVWPQWEKSVTKILVDSKDLPAQLSSTLQEIQETIQEVRTKILPNVETSIQSLKVTLQSLESMSTTYKQHSPEWAAKVTRIIQNVSQISVSAEKAIDEISASPWRLLYRPTDREISYEQLNAASWKLLTALSDLKESAVMLEEVSLSPEAPSDAQSIAASLRESSDAFEKARSAILERMKLDFPDR